MKKEQTSITKILWKKSQTLVKGPLAEVYQCQLGNNQVSQVGQSKTGLLRGLNLGLE